MLYSLLSCSIECFRMLFLRFRSHHFLWRSCDSQLSKLHRSQFDAVSVCATESTEFEWKGWWREFGICVTLKIIFSDNFIPCLKQRRHFIRTRGEKMNQMRNGLVYYGFRYLFLVRCSVNTIRYPRVQQYVRKLNTCERASERTNERSSRHVTSRKASK